MELDDYHDHIDGHPRRRMRRKMPPETVEWDANLAANTSEVMMMMRRKLTRRCLEKRQEKELKWTEIPGEHRQKYLDRDEELFISQPVTGFPGMKPGQLVRVKKNIFGLATSPREWWEDLQDGFKRVKINIGEETYQFDQCPLDPCVFTLRKVDSSGFSGPPIGYVGTHVDDPETVSTLIEQALSQEFPIDDWEAELFSYLGSKVHCCDDEVVMSQKSYVDTRIFKLEIPEGANDDELASEDLVADNRSLVGALSWLSAQTRPDLTCAVSMAQ